MESLYNRVLGYTENARCRYNELSRRDYDSLAKEEQDELAELYEAICMGEDLMNQMTYCMEE